MMENNYIMLLTLTGFSFQHGWLRTGSRRALFWGSAALGLNLLTRLTTVLDLIAGAVLILCMLLFERTHIRELWQKFLAYCRVAAPVYAFFLLLDRLYQFYRFGSFTNTYVSLFAKEQRLQDPSLPANFPWSTPFLEGFLGPLFKPEKSIFLFDPLLVVTIVLLAILWKRLSAQVRAYAVTSIFLLLAYICFYARYTYWAGDFAWGDRYVSTAVELVALLAVPLLLQQRAHLGAWTRRAATAVIAISLIIQLASLAFWIPLEIYQMEDLGHPTFVIALRFKNIVAFALGKMQAWDLDTDAMHWDAWDYVHISTWNFLPFLLRRVGEAPRWVVDMAFAVWFEGIAALGFALFRLKSALRSAV
jgi:hypothetical protein